MAASRDPIKETAKWFESEFKCTKAHEIFHTLAIEKEKFIANIAAEPLFKENLHLFISALIGEVNRSLHSYEKQKCSQFCEQLGKMDYLYNIYPNLGAKVITITVNRYNSLFDTNQKQLGSEFSSLIRHIVDSCPRVSIPHHESYDKRLSDTPSPIAILSKLTYKKMNSLLRERANRLYQIAIRKEGVIRVDLTKKINRVNLSLKIEKQIKDTAEQKRVEIISNPLISVWLELTLRLHKDGTNTASKEFLVIFQELCRSLIAGQLLEATHILLAGIQINAASSSIIFSSRERAKLLIELMLPFASFHSKFTSDQLMYVEYFHYEFANRLFEIGEHLQQLFSGLQNYLNQHSTENALFISLIATPKVLPKRNLCVWGTQKEAKSFGLFSLKNDVVGMQESLDGDPEEQIFPAELKKG